MLRKLILLVSLLSIALCVQAQAKGKLVGNSGGNEREAVVYSRERGLEEWTITGPDGLFEFSLEPGEYMVSCGGRLVPYVRIRDGQTTYVSHADDPKIEMDSEMWTPECLSFGQSYTAMGTAFTGTAFWMPQGSTKLKLILREDGPQGRIIGETETGDRQEWFAGIGMGDAKCPTIPGKTYYLELTSTENIKWTIGMPKGPDPYPGGIAYYDGVPHPESDLGIEVWEARPGLVRIAGAQVDQHFIKEGPGSGSCTVAGQSFVARNGRNVISVSANCGFGGGVADFIYTIREGGPDGKVVVSKTARMVSDWGTTAYFLPNEVTLTSGAPYYFEYKRADGQKFYSYLSADVYPDGKAYRDGKEVEGGFDQMFDIIGEVEPEGITFPYNVKVTDVTSSSAKITWETGNKADGIIYYGNSPDVTKSAAIIEDPSTEHSVVLTDLAPGKVCYFRVTSFTHKEGATRAWGRTSDFMTLPAGKDEPRYAAPEPPGEPPASSPKEIRLVNGGFEEGLEGWQRCSFANPKKYEEAEIEYPIGNGPFGSVTSNSDGYKPYYGKAMYGWYHLGIEDPNPILPREDWKQEVIYQRIPVTPGRSYVLKAWAITGDRDSGWGRDSRLRLVVDTKDAGLLEKTDTAANAEATQWFGTQNRWLPLSLRFTAEKDTVAVGVHFMQWWALEANYLYVDDVRVEQVD